MSHTREGGCRCGQVRFRLAGPPMVTMACHCKGCQRMTAGPYSLSVLVAEDAFEVTAGDTVLGGARTPGLDHNFCPACMSWLFTRPQGVGPFVNVRTPMLDDPAGLEPFIDTQTAERLPWITPTAPHKFEAFPDPAAFGPLIEAYRQRG